MFKSLDSVIGVAGVTLTAISMEQVSAWVGLICSLVITMVTCGVQAYRLVRDRDEDKKPKEQNENKED